MISNSAHTSPLTDPITVTIMIPTYNQAMYVGQAIESALSQTWPHLQIVVGDDASTDDTARVVQAFRDTRLTYVRNDHNLGRVGNYRHLLQNHARGDFVVNLDGDDYFTDPDFISEAMRLLAGRPDAVMVVARACTVTPRSRSDSTLPGLAELTGIELVRRLPQRDCFFMHMATLYARQQALALDFYRSAALSSDWESLYRLALRGRVLFLERTIGVWRLHGRNETAQPDRNQHLQNLSIWPAIFADAVQMGMGQLAAWYHCSHCVAWFALLSSRTASLNGTRPTLAFLARVALNYPAAAVMLCLRPRYAVRLLLTLAGYDRRRKNA